MRILAVDIGEKRIGVALSDALGWLATPLTVITYKKREEGLAAIAELVRTHQVGQVIVGYPRSLNGTVGPQARQVDKFVAQLRARLEVPIVLWDERLSTAQAERLVHETGRSVQRERIDALAAAVILQSYLDAQRH
ncbi:MAG: Holliday junction resolvase RuvX [Chloroflexi bacterium]|nr:Holliday junction resolvase RuvX [Chloroflexota bacterium]